MDIFMLFSSVVILKTILINPAVFYPEFQGTEKELSGTSISIHATRQVKGLCFPAATFP